MANEEIKRAVVESGLKLWQVAAKLGLNDGNFSRKLRFELSDRVKENIFVAIEGLKKEANDL